MNATKKAYWAEQCEEIEKLHRMNHSDKVYEKVKMLSGGMKMSSQNNAFKDRNGELIRNDGLMLARWRDYIEELYNKDGKPQTRLVEAAPTDEDDMAPLF